ncbi:MAG: N-acetyltransferase [Lachnospiraceae bacterium]|nr:N-acetyltransferase [Lachnospiraceae bacterium]
MIDVMMRNIENNDLFNVECLAKKAFWNLNMPGCDEHYLIHRLWNSEVCVQELSLLAEYEGAIIGAILYARAKIKTVNGEVETLTFGPLCVEPSIQKNGVGKLLLEKSMEKAKVLGFSSIFICGVPTYYPKYGFKTADKFGITLPDGTNFDAFMGIELIKGSLDNTSGKFYEPDVYCGDIHNERYMLEVECFDKSFPYMEKKVLPHQWR